MKQFKNLKTQFLIIAFIAMVSDLYGQGTCACNNSRGENNVQSCQDDLLPFISDIINYGFNYDGNYSIGNATVMAYLANQIFLNEHQNATDNNLEQKYYDRLRAAGFTVNRNDVKLTRAYEGWHESDYIVFTTAKATFVIFRGTEVEPETNFADAITNLMMVLAQRPNARGKVHPGYYGAIDRVLNDVNRQISIFDRGRNKKVYVTGHSLGGALATMFAYRRANANKRITAVYPFGNPRVGDLAFQQEFTRQGIKCYRFKFHETTVKRDHVPEIPKSGRCIGNPTCSYKHVGEFYKIENQIGSIRKMANKDDLMDYSIVRIVTLMEHHHSYCYYLKPIASAAMRDENLISKIEQKKNEIQTAADRAAEERRRAEHCRLAVQGGFCNAFIGTWNIKSNTSLFSYNKIRVTRQSNNFRLDLWNNKQQKGSKTKAGQRSSQYPDKTMVARYSSLNGLPGFVATTGSGTSKQTIFIPTRYFCDEINTSKILGSLSTPLFDNFPKIVVTIYKGALGTNSSRLTASFEKVISSTSKKGTKPTKLKSVPLPTKTPRKDILKRLNLIKIVKSKNK